MDYASSYFFTAKGGLFERPAAAFLNRDGCCRQAMHDIGDDGDDGDDKKENLFSDWRHHQPQ